MPPEEQDATQVPPLIHDYELLRRVGRGSYGDVWLARGATGLLRAVKIVWRNRFTDPAPYDREFNGLREFARSTTGETRQLALLHVGRNEKQGFFYYVMELADDVVTGREIDPSCYAPLTFKVLRDRDHFLPTAELIPYAIELARGLVELHGLGLIHRDIKPSNIIVVDGRPKLADVGLVALADQALTFVGTEGFVPPEGPGTVAADLYSFGKVLYELATGRDRNDFPRLPPDISDRPDRRELLEVNEIIVKACAPRIEERYPDAAAMLAELRLLEAGKSVRRLRFAEAGLARARRWIIAGVIATAVATAGALVERGRADFESAGRRAAEADLAALTRQTLYTSSIANAQRWISVHDFGPARAALQAVIPSHPGDPDLRGFEWYAIAPEAAGDPSTTIRAEGTHVERLVYSPDDQLLAVDDASTNVELYDIASGQLLLTIPNLHRLAGFTPDGTRLVGTTTDYEIETWSVRDGTPDPRPNVPGIFRPLAVATHAPLLAYFEDSRTEAPHHIGIRNLTTGTDLARWPIAHSDAEGKQWEFSCASLDRDLRFIVLCMQYGSLTDRSFRIALWDLASGTILPGSEQFLPGQTEIRGLISPDGDRYYVQDAAGTMAFDRRSRAPLWPAPAAFTFPYNSAISPDGRWIASCGSSKQIEVFDTVTGQVVRQLDGQLEIAEAFAWPPDGQRLATGSRAGDVLIWHDRDRATPPTTTQLNPEFQSKGLRYAVFDSTGDTALLSGMSGDACLLDTTTLQITPLGRNLGQPLWFEGGEVWWLTQKGSIRRESVQDATSVQVLPLCGDKTHLRYVALSPDGHWIACIRSDSTILVWDRVQGTLTASFFLPDHPSGIAVHNDGRLVLSNFAQMLQIRDPFTQELLQERHIMSRPNPIEISPDDAWIALHDSNVPVSIVSNADLHPVISLPGTYRIMTPACFSPDGTLFVAGATYGTIRLFDTTTWQERPSLVFSSADQPLELAAVIQIAFSHDGRLLLATNAEGRVRIWRRGEDSFRLAPSPVRTTRAP